MIERFGQARPHPARVRRGCAAVGLNRKREIIAEEISMKDYVKDLMAGLAVFLAFVMPAYSSPLTESYSDTPFVVTIAEGEPSTPGAYIPTQAYMVGGQSWVTALTTTPLTPAYLPAITSADSGVLTAAFPGSSGLSFVSSVTPLAASSLVVESYAAVGSSSSVGAQIYLQYVPTGADPTRNVHWIQIINDNYNITNNPGYGNPENVVDTRARGRSPYYDDGGAATSRAFFDSPNRLNPNQMDTWTGDLYLVAGPAAGTSGTITIWGGLEWGWNTSPAAVPLPPALLLFAPALAGIGAIRRRVRH
jgi:hypothetical protein